VYVRQTPRHYLRDGCICYTEGRIVVYSVSESDFVRRVAANVCLYVINTNAVQHQLLSTDQEMIPATAAINKHSQDFMVNNELLLPILKAYAKCNRPLDATRNA